MSSPGSSNQAIDDGLAKALSAAVPSWLRRGVSVQIPPFVEAQTSTSTSPTSADTRRGSAATTPLIQRPRAASEAVSVPASRGAGKDCFSAEKMQGMSPVAMGLLASNVLLGL